MKNLTKNMMIAAAALVVAAGAAQAQSIKAEVPFSFRAVGTVMPAGEYWVTVKNSTGGTPILSVTNRDTHRSIMAMPYPASSRVPANHDVSLTFECSGASCALVKVAPGTGHSYQLRSPKFGGNEDTRVAVIRAVLMQGR
jgi:hypothetical protein